MHFPAILSNYIGMKMYICRRFIPTTYFLVVLLRCCYGFHRINTDDIYASQAYYEASLKTLADIAVNVAVLMIFTSQTISYF